MLLNCRSNNRHYRRIKPPAAGLIRRYHVGETHVVCVSGRRIPPNQLPAEPIMSSPNGPAVSRKVAAATNLRPSFCRALADTQTNVDRAVHPKAANARHRTSNGRHGSPAFINAFKLRFPGIESWENCPQLSKAPLGGCGALTASFPTHRDENNRSLDLVFRQFLQTGSRFKRRPGACQTFRRLHRLSGFQRTVHTPAQIPAFPGHGVVVPPTVYQ